MSTGPDGSTSSPARRASGVSGPADVLVIATGVTVDGPREVLGCNVGNAETLDFWKEFLVSLRDRGLHGVQLVIPDQYRGLVSAIEQSMAGAAWQRCRGALHA